MTRTIVISPETEIMREVWGISPAVRSGDMLFVGGQVGIRRDGSVSDDPAEQIHQAFENLATVLVAGGASTDDVLDLTAFYADYPAHGGLTRAIRERHFPAVTAPTWTAIGVAALAEPFVFEMKAVARLTV